VFIAKNTFRIVAFLLFVSALPNYALAYKLNVCVGVGQCEGHPESHDSTVSSPTTGVLGCQWKDAQGGDWAATAAKAVCAGRGWSNWDILSIHQSDRCCNGRGSPSPCGFTVLEVECLSYHRN
jgi:hypothetical protein